jgi:hypothetical protein
VETLPVPKELKQGETAEIRCELVREGEFDGHRFHRERVGLHYVKLIIAGGEAESEQPQTESCQ